MKFQDRMRITLSQTAKMILKRDMLIFQTSKTAREGTFINTIIKCFLDDEFELSNEFNKQKGISQVYYICDENVYRLEDSKQTNQYLTGSEFIKAVIESYCRFPCIEREKIILRDVIFRINNAIHSKNKITIKTFKGNFIVLPYKIVPSREALYSYLIAYNGENFNSYRLSLIKAVSKHKEKYEFKQTDLNRVDNLLIEFGPTFAFEKIEVIQIQFLTQKAEDDYLYSSIHRPIHSQIIDEENRIYEFKCSIKQATYFFFRFAGSIKILSPAELKITFRNMYKSGYESTAN